MTGREQAQRDEYALYVDALRRQIEEVLDAPPEPLGVAADPAEPIYGFDWRQAADDAYLAWWWRREGR